MRAVNLLPREDASEGRRLPAPPILTACVGAVVVTALLAVLFLSGSGKVAEQQRALDDAQATYNALPEPAAPSAAETQLPQLRQTRVTALASALGQRVVWDRLLRQVSQIVPTDVWLVSLNAQAPSTVDPTAAAGSTSQTFSITGCTYSQESVARFLARLDVVPELDAVTLGRSDAGGSGGGSGATSAQCPTGMVTFSIGGAVRAAGATS
jgi:Tfp pilus assembly protein PilN